MCVSAGSPTTCFWVSGLSKYMHMHMQGLRCNSFVCGSCGPRHRPEVGVLMAELVKHYFPRLVELHNYSGTQSVAQKVYNWETLEKKAFRKLNFPLSRQDMQAQAFWQRPHCHAQ